MNLLKYTEPDTSRRHAGGPCVSIERTGRCVQVSTFVANSIHRVDVPDVVWREFIQNEVGRYAREGRV